MKFRILICAGGTAGHINAALAIGEEFKHKGWEVYYFGGRRPLDFKLFRQEKFVSHIFSAGIKDKNIFLIFWNLILNAIGLFQSLFHHLINQPTTVLGVGGYVCGPSLLSARILGKKVYALEQNSNLGLTNKLLLPIVEKMFIAFEQKNKDKRFIQVGNPVRKELSFLYNEKKQENKMAVRVLAFGGSLGAAEINEKILELIKKDFEYPISIIHQSGIGKEVSPDSLGRNVEYQQVEYIEDMIQAYRAADIIVSRGGASSVFELMWVGKPVFIIPARFHSDKQQVKNAEHLKNLSLFPVTIASKEWSSCELKVFIDSYKNYGDPTPLSDILPQEKVFQEIEGNLGLKHVQK